MFKIFRKKDEKGFTLIELMIVIAIIGILAAIAIPQFMYYKKKGAVAILNSDCKNAYLATIAYFVDNPNASTITYPILRYAGFTATGFVTLDTDNFVDQENFTIICQGSPNWLVAPAEVRVTNAELKLVESFILR